MRNRIRELRKKNGLSMRALAERIGGGVTPATIMKLEKGAMNLTTDWMGRIAKGLGCAAHDLLELDIVESEDISDAEIALTDAIKDIIQIILHHGLATPQSLDRAFSFQLDHYRERNLPNATLVMQELRSYVLGEPREAERDVLRRLLQLGRSAGSA